MGLPGRQRKPVREVPDKSSSTLAIQPQYHEIVFEAKHRTIRIGRWKLVCQPDSGEVLCKLFDLETDLACQHNRIADKPELIEALKQKLTAWVAEDAGVSG